MAKSSKRSQEAEAYRRLYKTRRWASLRELHLSQSPLCVYCLKSETVNPADVVDHVRPHKGDLRLFWDRDNLQSLCASCHDKTKQKQEKGQEVIFFGPDGFPL